MNPNGPAFLIRRLAVAIAAVGASLAAAPLTAANAQIDPSAVKAPVASGPTENIPPTYQGPSSAVAAIVDNSVVTTYDVQQRMKLMIVSAGGRLTADMLGQLQERALRDLVEERLKIIEAKRFEKAINDKEVDQEIQRIAGQGGMTVPQLEEAFGRDGISLSSLREQIGVGMMWPQIVQGRFGNRVRVSDEEVDATYMRMREDATKEQFLVSEICIPVPDPNQAQAYFQGALQLLEQMRRGVPFAVVAQQFSACTSAAAGGDIGWVRAGELPDELNRALKELPVGAVTNPIPSEGAFMILAVRDKRQAVEKGVESFTFAYAAAPVSIGRNAARQALERLASSDACSGGLRQDLGRGVGMTMIENVTLEDIDERFRGAVEDLNRGELSPIVEADDALHAVFVCDKDEGLGLPSREAIEDRIFSRQLTRLSQQYLRDVERQTLVEIRLRAQANDRRGAPGQ